jgi:DNA helicase II / ATP-dependent DNA helicase PcrA
MTDSSQRQAILEGLNPQQREAVVHGEGPLLIVAGAGTGKTRTLVHRVAYQISRGVPPARILLLTFTRRAAAEMLRRVDTLFRQLQSSNTARPSLGPAGRSVWGGTFHATAARLLRVHAPSAGLDPDFTSWIAATRKICWTSLAPNWADEVEKRFPRKGTCLAIYSHCVNSARPLDEVLKSHFPWCQDYVDPLKELFPAYGERKEQGAIWTTTTCCCSGAVCWPIRRWEPRSASGSITCWSTNTRTPIGFRRRSCGCCVRTVRGLTAVGDDAQSIYAFRAATIRNILDFPADFPGTEVVKLEQNYRSTQPILNVTNEVIAQARERYTKDLWTDRNVAASGRRW